MRRGGGGSVAAASTLLDLLPEEAGIYEGRGPREIARLRGYLLLLLAEGEPPPGAALFAAAELLHGHDAYVVAAAARLAAELPAYGETFAPYLAAFLDPSFMDEEVSFASYDPPWPLENPTTARFEAVEALGRLGCGAWPAASALRHLTEAGPDHPFHHKEDLRRAAGSALERIEASEDCPEESGSTDLRDAQRTWLGPADREPPALGGVTAVDQDGEPRPWSGLLGRPVALTFFYSRCGNPNKCSMTVSRFARLQKALRSSGLGRRVHLAAVTLEPDFDEPLRLRRYAEGRGLELDGGTWVLRTSPADLGRLVRELEVGVSFGRGQVGLHGMQLFLLDRQGRLAVRYDRLVWPEEDVLADLEALAGE